MYSFTLLYGEEGLSVTPPLELGVTDELDARTFEDVLCNQPCSRSHEGNLQDQGEITH
jgi:hypothetical protein